MADILSSRARGALIGLAVCDALGAPVEFKKRGTFSLVTDIGPNHNFDTPAGAFTDDTSMALCLAHSLIENEGLHNPVDQVQKYFDWYSRGYMSSVGYCFDIGNMTRQCLGRWRTLLENELGHLQAGSPAAEAIMMKVEQTIRNEFNQDRFCGNGSLMRVLPVALLATSEAEAAELAVKSSMTTHPHPRCLHACELYARLVFQATLGADKSSLATTLAKFVGSSPIDEVLKSRLLPYKSIDDWQEMAEPNIKSTGYVVDTLEASLWALFTTDSFEQGAIKVVNLGDDADTVGAIYGGFSGAFYGIDAVPQRWLRQMKCMDLLEETAGKLAKCRQILR